MASGSDTQRNRRGILLTSLVSFLGALLLIQSTFIDQEESRFFDLCFAVVHSSHAHRVVAPQIGFVSIDDKSVDPFYSKYSSEWGREGWLTRYIWDTQLLDMGQIYQPKVLAFDILFQPLSANDLPESDPGSKTVRELEAKGDQEFLNDLCNYDDSLQAGQPAPYPLFAFEFPDDEAILNRSSDEDTLSPGPPDPSAPANAAGSEKGRVADRQKLWFHKLDRFRLPSGSVLPGGNPLVHRAVRLPMDDILSAPTYFLGPINADSDADGIYRRAPLIFAYRPPGEKEIRYLPSFALEAFLLWLDIRPSDLKSPGQGLPCLRAEPGGLLTITTTKREVWSMPVDRKLRLTLVPRFKYKDLAGSSGPDSSDLSKESRFSFVELLKHAALVTQPIADDETVKRIHGGGGMILVVGQAFTGGTDVGNFPLEQEHEVPRPLLHLNVLNNILQRDHVYAVPWLIKVLICFGLAAAMAALHGWTTGRVSGIGSFTLIFLYFTLLIALVITENVELPLIAPMALMVFCFGFDSYQQYVHVRQAREEMRRLFSSVTSPRILRMLEENPEAFHVHRKTSVTMLFSDVEGFTSLSEKLDPEFLAKLINRYLSPMTEIILQEDGYLDKYSGDGIMAIWGVPLPDEDHAYKACVAAWKQLQAANAIEEILPDGRLYRFRIRIGVNTGMVSAGNMGSAQKMQYTVMGDEVNLSARLEPTNKDYGTQLIIGPATHEGTKGRIWARRLDKIIVKGRSEAVLIYELLGLRDQTPVPGEWLAVYEQGMEHLWTRGWDEADRCFEQAILLRGGDPPSALQRSRIHDYRLHPPPEDWQGEFMRLEKD